MKTTDSDMLQENPYNIVRVDLAADGYDEAAARWSTWLRDGIVAREERPAFYAYRQDVRRAVGPAVRALGLDRGSSSWPRTMKASCFPTSARCRMQNKIDWSSCGRHARQLSPVFGMHFGAPGSLDEMLADVCTHEPAVDITDADGVEHRLWVMDDPEVVNAIQAALAPAKIVIADGHHRYETALAFRDEQRAKYRGNDPRGRGVELRHDGARRYGIARTDGISDPPRTAQRAGFDVGTLEARLETAFRLSTVSLSSAGGGGRRSPSPRTLTAALDELGRVPGFAVYSGDGRAFGRPLGRRGGLGGTRVAAPCGVAEAGRVGAPRAGAARVGRGRGGPGLGRVLDVHPLGARKRWRRWKRGGRRPRC